MTTEPTLSADQSDRLARMRQGIRATVLGWGQGAHRGIRRGGPWAVVGALAAAALAPVVWPLAGATGISAAVLGALIGQAGNVGTGYLTGVIIKALDRCRHAGDRECSPEQLQEAIGAELQTLSSDGQDAVELRREVATLLRAVGGIDTAVSAAVQTGVEEIQQALLTAFTDLGSSVTEFAWMQDQTRQALTKLQHEQARQGLEQRHQTDLARETLTKTTLILQRVERLDGRPRPPHAEDQTTQPPDPGNEPPAPGVCPYMGLRSFQAEDAQWFFGRQRLTAELAARLSEAPLLAVVGASGSGKSSLLGAGLLPAAWAGIVPGASGWITLTLTPTSHPLEELAARLALRQGLAAGALLADLCADPQHLRLAIRQILADAPAGNRVLIVIDQVEEIFTLCHDNTQRQAFLDALAALATDPGCGATVVLGIRADFYPRCAEHPPLAAALQDHQLLVTSMTQQELRAAIIDPAHRTGLVLEPGLAETILAELGEQPGSLPLLSHALSATWERRRGNTLTCAGYRDAGGVRQAIGQTAETVYGALTAAQQGIAKDIFVRLTALGEGTEDTRRRVTRSELLSGHGSTQVHEALQTLAAARLITLGQDSVDVAHEALIREWPRLRGWLDEDRDGLRLGRALTTAAHDWATSDRDKGLLYRGTRLVDTRAWIQRTQPRLNQDETDFLAASTAQERRSTMRRRALLVVLSVLVLVISGVAVGAFYERDTAIANQIVTEADQLRGTDVSLAAQLDLTAYRMRPNPNLATALITLGNAALSTPLTGHTGAVNAVAFSPNGHTLATGSADHTVRLWNVTNPARPTPLGSPLTGHTGAVNAVAFSPDGRTLATGSADHTVRLWNVTDPARAAPLGPSLTGHASEVFSVAFSPDGRILASAGGSDQTVRLWNVTNPTRPAPVGPPLTGYYIGVFSVAFSPDGHTLASVDRAFVWLWNVTSPAHPIFLGKAVSDLQTSVLASVAFSPDGHTLATGGADHTVQVWNVTDLAHPSQLGPPLTGSNGGIFSVAFNPDGHTLASASSDQTVRLWNLPTVLSGHTGGVNAVAFSPDGRTLASAGSGDQTVRLWNVTNPTRPTPLGPPLTGHTNYVTSVAFTPDGHTLAIGADDQTVRLWNVTDPARPTPLGPPLTGHTGAVNAVAFSPDGHTLATGSADYTVRLWNVTDPTRATPLGPPLIGNSTINGAVLSVAFSPDGHTLASGGFDRTVRLWDIGIAHTIQRICATTANTLTTATWNQYVPPELPYHPPCP